MPVGPGALLPALSSPLAPYSAVSALSPERVPPPLHFHSFFSPLKSTLSHCRYLFTFASRAGLVAAEGTVCVQRNGETAS